MAWLRWAGGGKSNLLYDRGSWNIAYETPGSYTASGFSVGSAVLNSDNIQFNPSASTLIVLGTVNKVDLTNYNYIKVKAKTNFNGLFIQVVSTKALTGFAASIRVPISADYNECLLDVSALTGEYYIALETGAVASGVAYVNEVSLIK